MSERELNDYFADLHVHIGRDSAGNRSKCRERATDVRQYRKEAATRKGIDIVAVVDCASQASQT